MGGDTPAKGGEPIGQLILYCPNDTCAYCPRVALPCHWLIKSQVLYRLS
jgi:hypothetical protein